MSGKSYYIDANGTPHLIKKKYYVNSNGIILPIKKCYKDSKNVFSSSHIVQYHIDTNNIISVEVDDGGDAVISAPTASRSGWIFVGWREDTTASTTIINKKTVVVDNIHLYAVFKQTITVTLSGGSSEIKNTGTKVYNNGNVSNPSITLGTSAISGWSLVGYRSDRTATSSVSYIAGRAYTFSSNATLYAVFSRTLTLSYNGNTGSGYISPQNGTQYYNNGYYANPTFTLKANAFTKTDYRFDYWNIGSTSGTPAAANTSISISSNTTVYAHWTQTVFVVIDGDYSCTSENMWQFVNPYPFTDGMIVHVEIRRLAGDLSPLTYRIYYSGQFTPVSPNQYGFFDIGGPINVGGTASGAYQCHTFPKFIIANNEIGTGYVTNDSIHIKVWFE